MIYAIKLMNNVVLFNHFRLKYPSKILTDNYNFYDDAFMERTLSEYIRT